MSYRYVHRAGGRHGRRGDRIAIPISGAWVEDNAAGEAVHPSDLPEGAYLPEDNCQYHIDLPGTWAICDHCRGHGSHVNPNIDGNGLTEDDWADWDDDEREGYFSGRYDVPCEARCEGGKVWVVDQDLLEPWQQRIFDQWCQDDAESRRQGHEDARTRWYEDGCPLD